DQYLLVFGWLVRGPRAARGAMSPPVRDPAAAARAGILAGLARSDLPTGVDPAQIQPPVGIVEEPDSRAVETFPVIRRHTPRQVWLQRAHARPEFEVGLRPPGDVLGEGACRQMPQRYLPPRSALGGHGVVVELVHEAGRPRLLGARDVDKDILALQALRD